MSESTLCSAETALPQFRDVKIPYDGRVVGAVQLTEATAGKSRDRNGPHRRPEGTGTVPQRTPEDTGQRRNRDSCSSRSKSSRKKNRSSTDCSGASCAYRPNAASRQPLSIHRACSLTDRRYQSLRSD